MAALTHIYGFLAEAGEVTLSIQLDGADTLTVEYDTDSDFGSFSSSGAVVVGASAPNVGKVNITGLTAGTTYYYRIRLTTGGLQSVTTDDSLPPRFKCGPADDVDVAFKFGVVSCWDSASDRTVFEALQTEDVDLVVACGDQGYVDSQVAATIRTEKKVLATPTWTWAQKVLHKRPLIATWDDHDYGVPDGDGSAAAKATALTEWKAHYPTHTLDRPNDGTWGSYKYGNVEFFITDGRSRRDIPVSGWGRFPTGNGNTNTVAATTPVGTAANVLVAASGDSPGGNYGWYIARVTTPYGTFHSRARGTTSVNANGDTDITLDHAIPGIHDPTTTYSLNNASILSGYPGSGDQLDNLITNINASTARWKVLVFAQSFHVGFAHPDNWREYDGDGGEGGFEDGHEISLLKERITAPGVMIVCGDGHRTHVDDGTSSYWPETMSGPAGRGTGGSPYVSPGAAPTNGVTDDPPTSQDPDGTGYAVVVCAVTTSPQAITITGKFRTVDVDSITPLQLYQGDTP